VVPLVFAVLFAAATAAGATLVADGAAPQRVASGCNIAEGPAVNAAGDVYFSDFFNKRILKWTLASGTSLYREGTDGTNGMKFGADGFLYMCEPWNRRIARHALNGETVAVAERWDGKRFNQPNDLWIDPEGGIYFTDPVGFPVPDLEMDGMDVYYITPDRVIVLRVATGLYGPNGIVGTPDGQTLYVAEYGGGHIVRFDVNADGTLANQQTFLQRESDGMTLDAEGNLYVTGRTYVAVYNTQGQFIEQIPVPDITTNVAFAGPERKTLFVTTFSGAFTVEMRIAGASFLPASPALPAPRFVACPQQGAEALAVDFCNQTPSADGQTLTWLWSFGDGATSTERHPSHTYAAAGIYGVSLTVSSERGSSTCDQVVFVGDQEVSVASGVSLLLCAVSLMVIGVSDATRWPESATHSGSHQ
jgi:gluconolactonase